jgi:hypothetical protein
MTNHKLIMIWRIVGERAYKNFTKIYYPIFYLKKMKQEKPSYSAMMYCMSLGPIKLQVCASKYWYYLIQSFLDVRVGDTLTTALQGVKFCVTQSY